MQERVDRAKWLLKNVKHAAMATVNEDGTPHNSPYMFMASEDLEELYWGSHPNSVHSKNILRTGKLFVVLYDANEGGGLYISCSNGQIAEGKELERALGRHNKIRSSYGKEALPIEYYQGDDQKMWRCNTNRFWVNYHKDDKNGRIREDVRIEVNRSKLT